MIYWLFDHLVRPDFGAHLQFKVVALPSRTRTFCKWTFFNHFFNNFMGILKQNRMFKFKNRKTLSKTGKEVPKHKRRFWNRKWPSKTWKNVWKWNVFRPTIASSGRFVPKNVQKSNRTLHALKHAARTHIAHMFQNVFHMHTYDPKSHMNARSFATHPLIFLPDIFFFKMHLCGVAFNSYFATWKTKGNKHEKVWQTNKQKSN